MHIEVTQDDLQHGQRGEPEHCPLAHAIRRSARAEYVSVWPRDAVVKSAWLGQVRWLLPTAAQRFIWRFDFLPHCWPFVKPCTFDLTDPEPTSTTPSLSTWDMP